MAKIIKKGINAREELARGARFLSEIIGATLGPYGANVFLEKKKRPTNDGAKIAAEVEISHCVEHEDETKCKGCSPEVQNLGCSALREATTKTNEEAGDGTTTATVLAWAIYQAASRFLSKDGITGQKTPSEIVKQIENERKEITEKLIGMATPIITEQQLINSARVAVEDESLGEIIGKTQWELGKDGFILAEESNDRVSLVERVSGVRIDNGFSGSSTVVINNTEKQSLELQDVAIILTSYTIRDFIALKPVLDQFLKTGKREIAIIARAWTEEAIKMCQQNFQTGILRPYPMNAPYVDMQERFLDLAAITGAKFYDSEHSDLADLSLQDIGFAKKISARRWDAFITGKDDIAIKINIANRVAQLEEKVKGTESLFEQKNLKERIAQLNNGFALLKVGASSDMERKRLYDKCEDAVQAVRSAYQEGTVKGGGLAFKEISEQLSDTYLLKRPLMALYEQIMATAPSGFVVEDWVRDPVKVLRIALDRACSAAAAFATASGVIVTENPKSLDALLKKTKTEE